MTRPRKPAERKTHTAYLALDEFGLSFSGPWKDRALLVGWLKRKHPRNWRRFNIARVRMRVTSVRAAAPQPKKRRRP